MGKDRVIKSLGNAIGNVVVHRILVKYTNKTESIHHLQGEVDAYRDNAIEISKEFNWNNDDKKEIKSRVLRKFKNDMNEYYNDVKFPMDDAHQMIEDTLKEIIE